MKQSASERAKPKPQIHMVIQTTTKYGGSAKDSRDGFKLDLRADVSDAQRDKLAAIGLASVAYRGGANVINKALKVDSNAAAEYSEDGADAITTALADWAQSEKDSPLGSPFALTATVSRHTHGSSSTIKYAAERKVYARNAANDTLDKLAATIGYDGDYGTAEEPNVDMLAAIKKHVDDTLRTLGDS